MAIYFSEFFGVSEKQLERHGAFNVSLVTDLPLFVDPFLLFNSRRPKYRQLHEQLLQYLRFLRDKSEKGAVDPALIDAWYRFPEVKQNWLGFCAVANQGRGLGRGFADSLNANLAKVFRDFGQETITRGSHLERLCLIRAGVGRDMISDFTTNLIKGFLLRYTEGFTVKHIDPRLRRKWSVPRTEFDYTTECWMPVTYELPTFSGDYVILTPRNILTKDETWINHADMVQRFEEIPDAIEDTQLRAQINNYLIAAIARHTPRKGGLTREGHDHAVADTLAKFPALVDYYIKMKEDAGEQAVATSAAKVSESDLLYVKQFGYLCALLSQNTAFYTIRGNTRDEVRQRIDFFKDVIENKGGHRIFYVEGQPLRKETDIHILFRLVWHGTPSDVSREVNDGRGPADFKISRGAKDKSIVEFKLASNPQLRRNLQRQTETYRKASDAQTGFKVIVCFTKAEQVRVRSLLRKLGLLKDPNVVVVDARNDNKPSGSKA